MLNVREKKCIQGPHLTLNFLGSMVSLRW
uniref:Uncharacterized protein n=1 Tax=Nelumbo nucifera TaxID=4432 RepID=A0A822YWE4_NELNU|nr:TPA_asm: hypothetical protein HUJ06_012399 [Nelumbo nucifera]